MEGCHDCHFLIYKLNYMKGYIYTMYKGADPAAGWELNDPIFKGIPTMGSCRPDIRRRLDVGDYIFAISGKVIDVRQHVVGGFQIDQKIDQLTAFNRFPENRLQIAENGSILGNVIIDGQGNHISFDKHTNFENRLKNYLVGKNPVYFDNQQEINAAKAESLEIINSIFEKKENSIFNVVGRFGKKMNDSQVQVLLEWMNKIKDQK